MASSPASQTSPSPSSPEPKREPGPGGVGTAVAIDWGLTVQFLTLALLLAVGIAPPALSMHMLNPATRSAGVVGFLLVAAAFFALGEALRRGRYLAWALQLAFAILLLAVGVFQLIGTIEDIRRGHVPTLAAAVVLIIVNPVLVWLLTRPRTPAWFRSVSAAEAAARHGGRWLIPIIVAALCGGVLVALGI